MSQSVPTVESLRRDPDYRWNDDQTGAMGSDELWNYLIQQAEELGRLREPECSYGIYRELVWRYPGRHEAWEGLARFAGKLGLNQEAGIAQSEAERVRGPGG